MATGQFGVQYTQTAQDLAVAEHTAGFGADRGGHTFGRNGPDSAARRSRTQSIIEALIGRPPGGGSSFRALGSRMTSKARSL
jgi:hypothetical protein